MPRVSNLCEIIINSCSRYALGDRRQLGGGAVSRGGGRFSCPFWARRIRHRRLSLSFFHNSTHNSENLQTAPVESAIDIITPSWQKYYLV